MRWRRVGILLLVAVVAVLFAGRHAIRRNLSRAFSGPPPVPEEPALPPAPPATRVENRSLPDGRSYLLVSPAGAEAHLPVVLVIHGDAGSAESMRTYTGFDRASREHAHVAYAQVKDRYWGQERGYLRDVLADVARARSSDERNVFLAGWSSGAYVAQDFACVTSGIRAIALIEPHTPLMCKLSIPAIVFHNVGDEEHRIEEGDKVASELAEQRSCKGETVGVFVDPCVKYINCATPLAYCRVPGGSHYPWKHVSKVAWDFFTTL